jgi:hypothetical protein
MPRDCFALACALTGGMERGRDGETERGRDGETEGRRDGGTEGRGIDHLSFVI